MKKEKLIIAFFLFVFCMNTTSCKRDHPVEDSCNTSMDKIAGTDKISSMQYKRTPTAATEDFLLLVSACEKDDLITLNLDSTFLHKDAGLKCLPAGDSNGKWSLTGKTFKMDGSDDATVDNFDCQTLVMHTVSQIIPGDQLTVTLTRQ